jgi:hypothetical protein
MRFIMSPNSDFHVLVAAAAAAPEFSVFNLCIAIAAAAVFTYVYIAMYTVGRAETPVSQYVAVLKRVDDCFGT